MWDVRIHFFLFGKIKHKASTEFSNKCIYVQANKNEEKKPEANDDGEREWEREREWKNTRKHFIIEQCEA